MENREKQRAGACGEAEGRGAWAWRARSEGTGRLRPPNVRPEQEMPQARIPILEVSKASSEKKRNSDKAQSHIVCNFYHKNKAVRSNGQKQPPFFARACPNTLGRFAKGQHVGTVELNHE